MLIVNDDVKVKAEEIASEAARIYEEEARLPFPCDDCRWLRNEFEVEDELEGFIPDLSLWFSDVAGYCSWGKRILNWSEEKLKGTREFLSSSFFDWHPEYGVLERAITEENTPDIYEDLLLYERMRKKLLEVMALLLHERKES